MHIQRPYSTSILLMTTLLYPILPFGGMFLSTIFSCFTFQNFGIYFSLTKVKDEELYISFKLKLFVKGYIKDRRLKL